MKKRPLCILCLTFLIIQGVLLLLTSGDELVKVPASSIFFKQKQMRNVLVQGQVYKKKNTSKIQILYLKKVAATGVDYISVGALTHTVKGMDISMNITIE